MAIPAELKIGNVVIGIFKRLPSFTFTAVPVKRLSAQRSQDGTLFTQKLFEKYTVAISGLSQEQFEDLRFEYRRDDFFDLLSIVNRKEVFSGDGSTTVFTLSRRVRLDDLDQLAPIAFSPAGVTVTDAVFSNNADGKVTFVTPPASGTDNIIVKYFPVINGIITEMNDTFDWTRDEETWSITFEEG